MKLWDNVGDGMAIYYERTDKGKLRAYIRKMESWEDFEKIVGFILKNYGATIKKKYDGPEDTRSWPLLIKDKQIVVSHDDMGNNIYSPDKENEPLVIEIAERLSAYIDR